MGTSLLQRQTIKELDRIYGCHAVKENVRPDWLVGLNGHRLELDIFVPSAQVAIEVQGEQHYRFTAHYHKDSDGFAAQQERDRQKKIICSRKGIKLFEIASHSDLKGVISELLNRPIRPDPKHAVSMKAIADQEQEAMRQDFIRWATRHQRHKLQKALSGLNCVLATLPPDVQHTRETDKATALVIRRRNQLEKAELRVAREYEEKNKFMSGQRRRKSVAI